ncbi:hypothetical protein ACQPW1_10690 [Nocardia sp. CA-128927]|uniref:hypothetical protein n=1 Tax=Nocardia sp. CA-128927 TaxID=3239975 RepID=UPI003D9858EA
MTRPISGTRNQIDDHMAAWQLHVELATRIAVVPLPRDQGLLSEALSSLEVLADRVREILRERGPHDTPGEMSAFQTAAWAVTEDIVGPLLTRWKRRLVSVVAASTGAGPVDRERAWPDRSALRDDLERARLQLTTIAVELAELAGASSLIADHEEIR